MKGWKISLRACLGNGESQSDEGTFLMFIPAHLSHFQVSPKAMRRGGK